MSTTTKSPRRAMVLAHQVAQEALPPHSHRFSPRVFTQHQLFACLVLKSMLCLDYRGVSELLADCASLREAIGLKRTPHYTTLQKASVRLLRLTLGAGKRDWYDCSPKRVGRAGKRDWYDCFPKRVGREKRCST